MTAGVQANDTAKTKAPGCCAGGCDSPVEKLGRLRDVGCLQALGPFDDVELHHVSLVEGAEPFSLDCRVVYKDIGTVFAFDETVTFLRVEPLDFALHFGTFLLNTDDGSRPRRLLELSAHVRTIACPVRGVNRRRLPAVDSVHNAVDKQLELSFRLGTSLWIVGSCRGSQGACAGLRRKGRNPWPWARKPWKDSVFREGIV